MGNAIVELTDEEIDAVSGGLVVVVVAAVALAAAALGGCATTHGPDNSNIKKDKP